MLIYAFKGTYEETYYRSICIKSRAFNFLNIFSMQSALSVQVNKTSR